MKVILIRYGELTLKGKNRKEFERQLYNNIKNQLCDFDLTYRKDRNRIYINIEDISKFDEITEILCIVPGIHSFSIADTCELEIEAIKNLALANFDTSNPVFKVETKRSNKQFPFMSFEVSKMVGGHILFNNNGLKNMRVDLHNPKQAIKIEIQQDMAYVFHKTIKAMGGLPIGSAGKGVVLLSGGIDSPIAAIQAMKRGVKITCLHYSSPPYTNQESLEKVKSLVKVLHKFDRDIKFFDANFSDLQLAIHQECPGKYEVTILRRMMLKFAERLCDRLNTKLIVTGESLGQVASQTLSGMYVSDNATTNLVLRPLITMDKSEIIELAQKYKTYEISILPFEDCCVIFLPKNPSTAPKLDEVIKEEAKFDYIDYLDRVEYTRYTYDDIHNQEKLIDSLI